MYSIAFMNSPFYNASLCNDETAMLMKRVGKTLFLIRLAVHMLTYKYFSRDISVSSYMYVCIMRIIPYNNTKNNYIKISYKNKHKHKHNTNTNTNTNTTTTTTTNNNNNNNNRKKKKKKK